MATSRFQASGNSTAYGPDWANAWHESRLMRNSFLDQIRAAEDGFGQELHIARMVNTAGGAVTMGVGAVYATTRWGYGTWTQATTTYATVAHGTALALETASVNNNGHMIIADRPFSAVLYTVGTATVDGGGAYARQFTYWNGTDLASTITPLAQTTPAPGWVLGRHELVFSPPTDWATATSANITGLPVGSWYVLRFRATTAPAAPGPVAGSATAVVCAHPLALSATAVAANAATELVASNPVPVAGASEGIMAVTTTAAATNLVCVHGRRYSAAGVYGS